MKRSRLHAVTVGTYLTVAVLFLVFIIYMALFENASVEKTRTEQQNHIVENYRLEEIEDVSAPLGVREEYRWTLENVTANDTSLMFYLVHQYAEVYFDDELMYRLMPQEENRFGKSISSNWVTIPLYPEDDGKEIRVVITPVYQSMRHRTVTFEIGSFHQLYLSQLKRDLPQLILASVCLAMGLFMMFAQLFLLRKRKIDSWEMFYLGSFTMLLGIWKITDTRFSPFMFAGNTMVLGYLTIGALFLVCIPMALFLKERCSGIAAKAMDLFSLFVSCGAAVALGCQIFGIADLRQILLLAHMEILLLMVLLLLTELARMRRRKKSQGKRSPDPCVLLFFGAPVDLFFYYVKKSSSGLIFTLFFFLIYAGSLFILSIQDMNKRAYTDALTGLYNKGRWDELMKKAESCRESITVIMIDLNGLKYVNDTMGHETGNRMLIHFSNILRSVIPSTDTICRWGGDEFAVMLTDVDKTAVEKYLSEIKDAVDAYNDLGRYPMLSYAAGTACSSDFPQLRRWELLKKADEQMYINKQEWHEKNRGLFRV